MRLIVLLGILAARVSTGCGYICTQYLRDTSSYYYLNGVSQKPESPHRVWGVKLVVNGTEYQGALLFNICDKVSKPAECSAPDEESSGYFLANDNKTCFALSSSKTTVWKVESLEGRKLPDGIKITANNTDAYRDMFPLDAQFSLLCARDLESPVISVEEQKAGTLVVKVKSTHACGRDLLGPLPDILNNKMVVYPAMIILGLILLPFGIQVYRAIIVIIGFLLGASCGYIFLSLLWRYDRQKGEETKLYIILGISTVLGCVVSYFTFSIKRLAIFVVSCCLGLVVALQVYLFLAFHIEGARKDIVLILLCAFFGIGFGLVSDFSEKLSVVLSTAFGGAYLIVKGAGTLYGEYPEETTIVQRIQLHQFDQVPVYYYVYLGVMSFLGVVGCFIQFRKLSQEQKSETDAEDQTYEVYNSMEGADVSVDVPLAQPGPKKKRSSVQQGRPQGRPQVKLN